uniref:Cap-specific mRNA (nucleoside-2'-O-)-methyltransferase 2 n=1 Tax=Eptatretus burgeri TaxID=7764 RepID=A0A8C4QBE5_EPTBU
SWTWPLLQPDPELVALKSQLNIVKGKLSNIPLTQWHEHTTRTNRAGLVVGSTRRTAFAELCTQAWCKFHELLTFPLLPENAIAFGHFHSVHLCEAPGAFVASLNHYLSTHQVPCDWLWLATTLNPFHEANSCGQMIADSRLLLHTLPNWDFGLDDTGNLMHRNNLSALQRRVRNYLGPVHLVTADGSFDCQANPGEQEVSVASLICCEAVAALSILHEGGSLVLKAFTFFERSSASLLYLLACVFEELYVVKPGTSKAGNSEVYVVALRLHRSKHLSSLLHLILCHYGPSISSVPLFPASALPPSFTQQLHECCRYFLELQSHTILENLAFFPVVLNERLEVAQMDWKERFLNGHIVLSNDIGSTEATIDCSPDIFTTVSWPAHHGLCLSSIMSSAFLSDVLLLEELNEALTEASVLHSSNNVWLQSRLKPMANIRPWLIKTCGITSDTGMNTRKIKILHFPTRVQSLYAISDGKSVESFVPNEKSMLSVTHALLPLPCRLDSCEKPTVMSLNDCGDNVILPDSLAYTCLHDGDLAYQKMIVKGLIVALHTLERGDSLGFPLLVALTRFSVGLLWLVCSSFQTITFNAPPPHHPLGWGVLVAAVGFRPQQGEAVASFLEKEMLSLSSGDLETYACVSPKAKMVTEHETVAESQKLSKDVHELINENTVMDRSGILYGGMPESDIQYKKKVEGPADQVSRKDISNEGLAMDNRQTASFEFVVGDEMEVGTDHVNESHKIPKNSSTEIEKNACHVLSQPTDQGMDSVRKSKEAFVGKRRNGKTNRIKKQGRSHRTQKAKQLLQLVPIELLLREPFATFVTSLNTAVVWQRLSVLLNLEKEFLTSLDTH